MTYLVLEYRTLVQMQIPYRDMHGRHFTKKTQ